MTETTVYDVVIMGAGPYGLSIAAHLQKKGLAIKIFGKPLALWLDHMPSGMILRSRWFASSLSDPDKKYTLSEFLKTKNQTPKDPVPAKTFIEYALWFQKHVVPEVDERFIKTIEKKDSIFNVTLVDGTIIESNKVVMAPGLAYYTSRPKEYDQVPQELISHTSDNLSFDAFKGKRVVVVGGGQSALENTALMHEAGIDVQVVSRSPLVWLDPPKKKSFLEYLRAPKAGIADGWDNWLLEYFPYAFQKLSRKTKDNYLMGKGKNGPAGSDWLIERLKDVNIHEKQTVKTITVNGNTVTLTLSNGTQIQADHILLATGYKPDINRLPMLSEDLKKSIETYKGSPVLNTYFESSVPGLYFTGFTAHSSFGPLYRFVVGTDAAAKRIAQGIGK